MTGVFGQLAVEQKSPFDVEKLADKFRHKNTGWTIPEAYLCIIYAAASSDGSFDPKEIELIKGLVARSRSMAALGPQELAKADNVVNERIKSRSNALQEACETLPAEMCLPMFAHCVDIALSDGQLLKPEADFLQGLAKMLDIDSDSARRVMEVLLLKAQY